MDGLFWQRLHGGSTHLLIVLLPLFLKNCAHCHGDDARGTDEAPDLTKFHKSEAHIATVVKNGIKGEMPRFGQKLTDDDVKMLIRFILSLNGRVA